MGAKIAKPQPDEDPSQKSQLYFQWKKLKEIPPHVLQSKDLKVLILDFNEITEIPADISKLTSLVELSIAANQITRFPAELGMLTNLQDLNLGMNKITHFNGDFLTSLTKLRQIHFSSCQATTLPNMAHMTNLKQISLTDNNLNEFFTNNPNYPFPPNLDTINLSQCQLTTAPNFTNSPNLTSVDLSENKLTELPNAMLHLSQMKRLFLGGNHLTAFPVGFGESWQNIVVLSIPFNNFKTFPSEMQGMISLKNLDVRGNGLDLTAVPTSILHLLSILSGDTVSPNEPMEKVINIDYEDESPDLITNSVYLGCLQCARNKYLLQKLGVTHILTVAQFKPFYPDIFKYKVIDIEDANAVDILIHFRPALQFIDDALASGGKVLVHCRAGVSRSATIVTAYIMYTQKLNRDAGLEFVRARRSRILPNHGFYKQLGDWELNMATAPEGTTTQTQQNV